MITKTIRELILEVMQPGVEMSCAQLFRELNKSSSSYLESSVVGAMRWMTKGGELKCSESKTDRGGRIYVLGAPKVKTRKTRREQVIEMMQPGVKLTLIETCARIIENEQLKGTRPAYISGGVGQILKSLVRKSYLKYCNEKAGPFGGKCYEKVC